jgi:hypothetical protein
MQLKNLLNIFGICLAITLPSCAPDSNYPSARISNKNITMHLYLPDTVIGSYRATRFDWSGIVYSLEYEGHQYYGEWKSTHDPLVHEDIQGPVESFGGAGLGYSEASPGGQFIRIGVGILEKPDEQNFVWNKTYKILNHGSWKVNKGRDWIEFRHYLTGTTGWAYIYTKRIELLDDKPGFRILHKLTNTGQKTIETEVFNHNFFVIDSTITGPDFEISFPFNVTTESDLLDIARVEGNKIIFTKEITQGTIWLLLKGYGSDISDHRAEIINKKTGAGVRFSVNKRLSRLVFWATTPTLCPENFVELNITPGQSDEWISEYELFIKH